MYLKYLHNPEEGYGVLTSSFDTGKIKVSIELVVDHNLLTVREFNNLEHIDSHLIYIEDGDLTALISTPEEEFALNNIVLHSLKRYFFAKHKASLSDYNHTKFMRVYSNNDVTDSDNVFDTDLPF